MLYFEIKKLSLRCKIWYQYQKKHPNITFERKQERRPLLSINDHFRKIVIVGDDIHRKEDELGVLTVGLLDFLTDKNMLEQG